MGHLSPSWAGPSGLAFANTDLYQVSRRLKTHWDERGQVMYGL